jgi:hypothetical protein
MRPAILLCLLLSAATAQARLDESVQEIAARYGKPLKGVIAESPATVAGLYEKNGFRIVVGFYQDKDCYEKLQKIDPKKPNSFLQIEEEERIALLKANCKGCDWVEQPRVKDTTPDTTDKRGMGIFLSTVEVTHYTYNRSDGNATATYDDHSKVFTFRSLQAQKQKEAEEKKRQLENLKGF